MGFKEDLEEYKKKEEWITKVAQLLRQMEFSSTIIEYEEMYDGSLEPWETTKVCPICGCQEYHSDSCELQELLKEAEVNKCILK